jgi:hypothetical protein
MLVPKLPREPNLSPVRFLYGIWQNLLGNFTGKLPSLPTNDPNIAPTPLLHAIWQATQSGGGGGLPTQTGHAGEFLTTDGSSPSWVPIAGGGDMLAANNLSDLTNIATARVNLGGTATGISLFTAASAAAARAAIGAGTGTGDLLAANNLSDLANAATARGNLGGTTVGQNFFTLANPSAITFPRVNADNSVSALDAATFRTAIGAGTSSFSGAFSALSGIPTTLAGYGITDAQPLATILTTFSALANASGALVNNGAGALSYSALGTAAGLDVGPAIGQVVQFANSPSTGEAAVLFDSAGGNKLYLSYEASPGISSFELVLPLKNGNIVTTGDTGSVTSTMLAGSIAPSKIAGTAAILGANTFTGVQTLPNGTAGAPSLNFGDATTGYYKIAANGIALATSGAIRWSIEGNISYWLAGGAYTGAGIICRIDHAANNDLAMGRDRAFGWMNDTFGPAVKDVFLWREATQHLTLRNGTTAQILSVSNTWTSTTNFERFKIDWSATANTCRIGTSKGASGSARALQIEIGDSSVINLSATGGIGLYGVAAVAQATTAGAAATFVANTSLIADDTATFDGYTIGQVVKALRNIGALA